MTVARTTLAEQVAAGLIREIERMGLQVGDEIPPEGEIAREFGVNRLAVREAIRTLSAREILVSSQGRPARVSTPSAGVLAQMLDFRVRQQSLDLEDILDTRRVVECELARLAALRVGEGTAEASAAAALLDEMAQSVTDMDRFVELDVRFHAAIAEAADTRLLQLILVSLESVLLRARRSTFAARESRGEGHKAALTAHRTILQAIEDGDPDKAASAMEEHLRETRRDVDQDD